MLRAYYYCYKFITKRIVWYVREGLRITSDAEYTGCMAVCRNSLYSLPAVHPKQPG